MAKIHDQSSQTPHADSSWLTQSALNGTPLPRAILPVLLCGLIGAFLFTIVYVIEGMTRPGYNAWQQPVSALSLGPGGWVQQVNFMVFGIIILCTVPAIHRVLRGGAGSIGYPIMRALQGVSFILLGLFSQDPTSGYPLGVAVLATPTLHGTLHIIFSFVSFIALVVGNFMFARRFAREPRWHGWATYMVINGLLAIVFVALYGVLSAQHSEIAGLFERLPGIVDTLAGLLIIARLYKMQREGLETDSRIKER